MEDVLVIAIQIIAILATHLMLKTRNYVVYFGCRHITDCIINTTKALNLK